jgi:hypothetical protein
METEKLLTEGSDEEQKTNEVDPRWLASFVLLT